MPSRQSKVALVHDDFMQTGGAEGLFATIAQLYPDAPIYTSLVDQFKLPPSIDPERIKTSFIQKIPFSKYFYKALLLLYPLAFESFNFDDFDLVISSTTRFAKSIITKPKTVHISYVNSIPRFLWDRQSQINYLPAPARFILKPFFDWLRRWDRASSSRADFYFANSQNVAKKIGQIYNRKSHVVYPHAATNFFTPAKIHNWQLKSQNYFLVATRLVKWKKIQIAISAAVELGINLKIVGTGPDEKRLKRMVSGGQIEFLGRVSRRQLRRLYRNCTAAIVTQAEDFGIVPVEAQACGAPVIAYRAGGSLETIKDGQTGVFFEKQTANSLKDAISAASKLKWSVPVLRKNALKFSKKIFVKDFKKAVQIACQNPVVSK